MIQYTIAQTLDDLQQIQHLQKANLSNNIDTSTRQNEGFVTVEHSVELLEEMNAPYPHVIAKHGDQVVGYTLVMLRSMSDKIPILFDMFEQINNLTYKGQNLGESNYFIMGQVCIDKAYRRMGIFKKLYSHLSKQMSKHFDFIVTEVALSNKRSLDAHKSIGFEVINTHTGISGEQWVMIILTLNK